MQKPLFPAKKPPRSKMPGKIVPAREVYGVRNVGDFFSLESPKYREVRSFDPADREVATAAFAGMIGGTSCRS
jgi:hypothetical protein